MSYIQDSPSPRFQFSIRFLLGLTAGVSATCAFGASAGWDRLLFVAWWYALLTGYLVTAVVSWWLLQGARAPQPRLLTGTLVAKLVAGSLVFGWFLFLLLVGVLSRGASATAARTRCPPSVSMPTIDATDPPRTRTRKESPCTRPSRGSSPTVLW